MRHRIVSMDAVSFINYLFLIHGSFHLSLLQQIWILHYIIYLAGHRKVFSYDTYLILENKVDLSTQSDQDLHGLLLGCYIILT